MVSTQNKGCGFKISEPQIPILNSRNIILVKTFQNKLEGDHAGHIFGDLFGGSPELDNLLSQAKDVNLREYRRIERDWADALRANPPKKVEADIKINYDGISKRPISFEVNYKIDGIEFLEEIPNINLK